MLHSYATDLSQGSRQRRIKRKPIIDRSLNYGRHAVRRFAMNAGPVSAVLDVGAGGGSDLEICREVAPNAELHGIEGFRHFQGILRTKNIAVTAINVERDPFPFEDNSFDIVIANQVLEHLKDIFWTLDNISRILKPGGTFILGVPNLASLHNRILLAAGRQPTSIQNQSAHLRGYTRPDILKLMEAGFPGGFRLTDFMGGNFYPLPPFAAKPLARLFPSMAVSIFLALRKERDYAGSWLRYPIEAQLNTVFYVGDKNSLWSIDT